MVPVDYNNFINCNVSLMTPHRNNGSAHMIFKHLVISITIII